MGNTRNYQHGHTWRGGRSPTYRAWVGMRSRCKYPYHERYPRYGGRGITICERWGQFANFLADMGVCPAGHSLHRLDNDGAYEPGNCCWASAAVQNANKSSNRNITFRGRTQHIAAWARELGVSYGVLYRRLVIQGFPPEQVFPAFE